MSEQSLNPAQNVQVDFVCIQDGCGEIVKFNLLDCLAGNVQLQCPKCHHAYAFDGELLGKLQKLANLVIALREAQPVLGDCNIAVAVPGGEVKLPYALLLTRLNSLISLPVGDRKIDFRLWLNPAQNQAK